MTERHVRAAKARSEKLSPERRKEIAVEAANTRWAGELARWKRFGPHDTIVTAWAEPAHGPGWSNQPIWVLVRSQLDGNHRVECLQPHERSAEMSMLYAICHASHAAMTDAVRTHVKKMTASAKRSKVQP